MRYLIDNNILDNYKYIVCTQDTFVLKNKYDFNILNNQNTTACTINSYYQDGIHQHLSNAILAQLGLDKLDEAILTEPRKWKTTDWLDLTKMEIFKTHE